MARRPNGAVDRGWIMARPGPEANTCFRSVREVMERALAQVGRQAELPCGACGEGTGARRVRAAHAQARQPTHSSGVAHSVEAGRQLWVAAPVLWGWEPCGWGFRLVVPPERHSGSEPRGGTGPAGSHAGHAQPTGPAARRLPPPVPRGAGLGAGRRARLAKGRQQAAGLNRSMGAARRNRADVQASG